MRLPVEGELVYSPRNCRHDQTMQLLMLNWGKGKKGRQTSAQSTLGAAKCEDVRQFFPCESLPFIRCQMSTAKNSQSPLFRDAYPRALLWFPWDALPSSRVHSCLAVCTQRQFCGEKKYTWQGYVSIHRTVNKPHPTCLSTRLHLA